MLVNVLKYQKYLRVQLYILYTCMCTFLSNFLQLLIENNNCLRKVLLCL